jgi:hypothetical protein
MLGLGGEERRRTAQDRRRWPVLSLIAEYMRWAMRIPQPSRNGQYRTMARFAATHVRVPLIPLPTYVGRDAGLRIEAINTGHAAFGPMRALLHREIPVAGRVASVEEFRRALSNRSAGYYLWSVARSDARKPQGLASFFALPRAGFGGYIVLAGTLRGKGLLRPHRAHRRADDQDAPCRGLVHRVRPALDVAFPCSRFSRSAGQYRLPTSAPPHAARSGCTCWQASEARADRDGDARFRPRLRRRHPAPCVRSQRRART